MYIDMNNIYLEDHRLADAKNILEFSLAQLDGKSDRSDIQAKLDHHLAILLYITGDDEESLTRIIRAIDYYEVNKKKYTRELIECYTLQLNFIKFNEEKLVAARMIQLTAETGNMQALARLVEFILARLIRKQSHKTLIKLSDSIKDIDSHVLPLE
jgi:hypothetical protein